MSNICVDSGFPYTALLFSLILHNWYPHYWKARMTFFLLCFILLEIAFSFTSLPCLLPNHLAFMSGSKCVGWIFFLGFSFWLSGISVGLMVPSTSSVIYQLLCQSFRLTFFFCPKQIAIITIALPVWSPMNIGSWVRGPYLQYLLRFSHLFSSFCTFLFVALITPQPSKKWHNKLTRVNVAGGNAKMMMILFSETWIVAVRYST